jgi:cytochrome P450
VAWRIWVDEIPNDGVLKFFGLFRSSERLMPVSPAAVADVLVHKCYDWEKPLHFRRGSVKMLGNGILFAEGNVHKQQRKTLMPAFTVKHTKELYPMFWNRSQRMVEAIKEQGEHSNTGSEDVIIVEVCGWASKATLSIIEEAAMGTDTNAIEDPKEALAVTYRILMAPGLVAQTINLFSVWLPEWLIYNIPYEYNRAIKRNAQLIWDACNTQKTYIESPKQGIHPDNTIISTAVTSDQFSLTELVEQMKTFLIAGHETTATALAWAVYLLTQHPEMQKRLRDELSVLPSNVSASDIDGLTYLHAFCSEVLRFYPPVPATVREASRDTSILSTPVPKGTLIMLIPWAINTSKKTWGPDAQEFKPERWLNSPSGGAESNYALLTFLHGPRSCIGERFARGEFACLLAAWVLAFDTELEKPDEEIKVDMKAGLTVKPKGGIRVKLRALNG